MDGFESKRIRSLVAGGDGSCVPVADDAHASLANRSLPRNERFGLILGSDVCYEDPLPKALAHVLSQRRGGRPLTTPLKVKPQIFVYFISHSQRTTAAVPQISLKPSV